MKGLSTSFTFQKYCKLLKEVPRLHKSNQMGALVMDYVQIHAGYVQELGKRSGYAYHYVYPWQVHLQSDGLSTCTNVLRLFLVPGNPFIRVLAKTLSSSWWVCNFHEANCGVWLSNFLYDVTSSFKNWKCNSRVLMLSTGCKNGLMTHRSRQACSKLNIWYDGHWGVDHEFESLHWVFSCLDLQSKYWIGFITFQPWVLLRAPIDIQLWVNMTCYTLHIKSYLKIIRIYNKQIFQMSDEELFHCRTKCLASSKPIIACAADF